VTKAEVLAGELREALKDREGVRVTRPFKTAEIRVKDIMDSISAVEVAAAVAEQGDCSAAEVRVGPVRPGTNRLGTAWVRCPLAAANKLTRKGSLTLAGWSRARIEGLPERPVTCFRCLRMGHVRATCPGGADLGGACYRCGESGHLARDCGAPPKCPLCSGTGRPDNHRVGGKACRAPKRGERRRGLPVAPTKEAASGGGSQDPEPMEVVEDEQPTAEPRASTSSEHYRLLPPLSRSQSLEWEDFEGEGAGWEQEPSRSPRPEGMMAGGALAVAGPLPPSRPTGPITGGEPSAVTAPLQPSGPELVIREERVLNKRRILVPVVTRHEVEAAGQTGPSQPQPPSPAGQIRALEVREMEEEDMGEPPADAAAGTRPEGEPIEALPNANNEEEMRQPAAADGGGTPN